MREVKLVGTGLLALGIGYLLERGGVFLYATYVLVRIVAVGVAIVFLAWGLLISAGKRWRPVFLGFAIGCAIVGLAWPLESMATSPRKVFYIKALKIREGMPIQDAELVMMGYRRSSVEPGHISFSFQSGPQTVDVLVVHYDRVTMKIREARLSLD
jgi:hypothetical protein